MTNDSQHATAFRDNESDTSLKISELVATAWRRKWLLVGCLVVSLLLGLAYIHQLKTVYQIKARLLVEEGRSPLQQNARKDEGFLATQAEIFRSPAVVGRAVGSLNTLGPQQEGSIQAVTILESLKVTPLAGTNVLSVGLQAGDRHEGVRTVEAIIANYREYLREMDRSSHVESLRLLTQQEKELRSELEGLQQEYYELRKESPLMDQAREEQQQMLQQLGRSMAEARNRKIELEHRIAALGWSPPRGLVSNQARQTATVASNFRDDELLARRSTADAAPDASERRGEAATVTLAHAVAMPTTNVGFATIDGLASIEKKLSEAHVHVEELSQRCGPEHPEFKAARARISISERQLDDTIAAARTNWEQQLSSLRVHEVELTSLYNDETTKIKTLDMHLLKERQALDAIKHVQEVYDSIHGELRAWQLNNQAAASGQLAVKVTVLEPPAVTAAPIRPPSSALLAVCALLGLVCGGGVIATLERIDPKVGSPERLQDCL